jgi:hypothetical protein
VEVFDRQQFHLTVLQPLCPHQRLALWTMAIAATVESDVLVSALVALLNMPAQGNCAAALNVMHDSALALAQNMIMAIG